MHFCYCCYFQPLQIFDTLNELEFPQTSIFGEVKKAKRTFYSDNRFYNSPKNEEIVGLAT